MASLATLVVVVVVVVVVVPKLIIPFSFFPFLTHTDEVRKMMMKKGK